MSGFLGNLDDAFDRLRTALPRRLDEITMVVQRYLDDHDAQLFAFLRRRNPIVTTERAALVTLDPDVREVLNAHATMGMDLYREKMDALLGPFILGMDATSDAYRRDHALLRSVVRAEDLPRLRARYAEQAQALLDGCGGSIDLVSEYADVLVHDVHGHYFGTPGPDRVTQLAWGRALFEEIFINVRSDPEMSAAAAAAADAAGAELDERIRARKQERAAGTSEPDDVLGRLLDLQESGEDAFDDLAIRNNLLGLSIGWLPTVTKALALAMDELLSRPDELAGAQDAARAGNEDGVRAYVFEALRFRPHNSGLLRKCLAPHTVAAGTERAEEVAAGSVVYAATQSAMFDEDAVDEPGTFRTDRPEDVYLHFGHGAHTCFGEPLNRMQLPALAMAVLARPGLARADDMQWDGLFPSRLQVTFEDR